MKLQLSDKSLHPVTPGMIGLFFEDINYAADGGLYAEMIENRSFEAGDAYGNPDSFYLIPDPGYAWSARANEKDPECLPRLLFVTGDPLSEQNPHYLRFTASQAGQGFANKAYDGICLKKGMTYHVSFYARLITRGNASVLVSVAKDGKTYACGEVPLNTTYPHLPFVDLTQTARNLAKDFPAFAAAGPAVMSDPEKEGVQPVCRWTKYMVDITADEDVRGADFVMTLDIPGTCDFDLFSMIPDDAVAGVFRKDLFEALSDLKPGFIRFPGGCIVEGVSLANRYRWKRTVGDLKDRKVIANLWAFDDDRQKGIDAHRPVDSHYSQSYGIGFYEFFLLCELLGARPLPVLNVGLACQFRTHELVSVDSPEFGEFVQDALDLVEFANGSADTFWGGLRARMGHPEPFGLTMIAAGNEQWETKHVDFMERAKRFEEAIHAVYPEIRVVGSAGPFVEAPVWKELWDFYRDGQRKRMCGCCSPAAGTAADPDFAYAVDEHYYVSPEWLYQHVDMYDGYSRDVGVFAGEYAAHTEKKENSMEAALAEAAFLTGVEKNGDVVKLASYAPLFNRIGHSQWQPDMIWFDDRDVYLTPSYYVQKFFSVYAGDEVLDLEGQEKTLRENDIYLNAVRKNEPGQIIVKIANAADHEQEAELALPEGLKADVAKAVFLTGCGCDGPEMPEKAELSEVQADPGCIKLPPRSFGVVVIPV